MRPGPAHPAPDPQAVAAARRVLAEPAAHPSLLVVELAAWILGRVGEEPPSAEPDRASHVRVAAAAGRGEPGELAAVLALLLPADASGLLRLACELAGPQYPDTLIELARTHADRAFAGRMLATTSRPDRLLDLFVGRPLGNNEIRTVGEVVIVHRDRGGHEAGAERRWAELVDGAAGGWAARCDVSLRLAARHSPSGAVELLEDFTSMWGRREIEEGAVAVLTRLVRLDPGRATALVAADNDPQQRLTWLDGLLLGPSPAPCVKSLLDQLLDAVGPEIALDLVRPLAAIGDLDRLRRALHAATDADAGQLAFVLAPGLRRLRARGAADLAEQVHGQCLRALSERADAAYAPDPADVFEVLAAPAPDFVPWGAAGFP